MSPPGLAFPNSTGHMKMVTEPWDKQVGWVSLLKQMDKTKRSIGYWSR